VEGAARLPDDGVVHQLAGRRGPLRILTVKRDPKCSLPVKHKNPHDHLSAICG
jgi:hypothetical protein